MERAQDKSLHRVESKGIVILEDNVDIGANSTIHRGKIGNTIIGKGTFIGPMCNIGHNVVVGKNCIISTGSLVCGYVEIGDNVRINPCSVIRNRVKIGAGALVGIGSLVMRDVPENTVVVGRPAVEISLFRKQREILKKLSSYAYRLQNQSQT